MSIAYTSRDISPAPGGVLSLLSMETAKKSPDSLSNEALRDLHAKFKAMSAEILRDHGLSIQSVKLIGLEFEPVLGVEVLPDVVRVSDYILANTRHQEELFSPGPMRVVLV